MRLTFLHVETTGLPDREPFVSDPALGPEVTEYAYSIWEDGVHSPPSGRLIAPRHTLPPGPTGHVETADGYVLSYRPDVWATAKADVWSPDDSLEAHVLLDGAYLAGVNPSFARDRLEWELTRGGAEVPDGPRRALDLSAVGYLLWVQGKVPGCSLRELARYYGVQVGETAATKVEACVHIWEAMHSEFIYRPCQLASALQTVRECSPDEGMAEYARGVLAGEIEA